MWRTHGGARKLREPKIEKGPGQHGKLRFQQKPSWVPLAFNPNTQEAKAGELYEFKVRWSTK